MAKVAINPVDLEDDFFDYSKVVIKKPWGQEYLMYRNDEIALWALHITKKSKTSMHCHPHKKTALIVLSGRVLCKTLTSENELTTGQGFVIEKGVFHSTEAISSGVVVMELETPTNKRDLVRLHDAYGRSGKGYEGVLHHMPLDDSLCHFHKQDERYHCEKKFGDCNLTVTKFLDTKDLQEKIKTHTADVVTVLKGNIEILRQDVFLGVGDTMPWPDFKEKTAGCKTKAGELLLIKKLV